MFYNFHYRRLAAERANRLAAFQLVIELVHPDNLGALPPAPAVLTAKAWLIGLGHV
jgi:hypothetical protein